MRAVCWKQLVSSSRVRRPLCQTNASATTTPSAADSVAVAMPKYRLPITTPNTISGGTRFTSRRTRSASGSFTSSLTVLTLLDVTART